MEHNQNKIAIIINALYGLACVASVSVRFRSKERPRKGIFGFVAWSLTLFPRSFGLNRTETLATQAIYGSNFMTFSSIAETNGQCQEVILAVVDTIYWSLPM